MKGQLPPWLAKKGEKPVESKEKPMKGKKVCK